MNESFFCRVFSPTAVLLFAAAELHRAQRAGADIPGETLRDTAGATMMFGAIPAPFEAPQPGARSASGSSEEGCPQMAVPIRSRTSAVGASVDQAIRGIHRGSIVETHPSEQILRWTSSP